MRASLLSPDTGLDTHHRSATGGRCDEDGPACILAAPDSAFFFLSASFIDSLCRCGDAGGQQENLMQRHPLTLAVLAALGAVSAGISTAALAADKEAVIVTATRIAQRSSDLLADVSVIERDEIERAGQDSLTNLLARQPGVAMTSNGGVGSTSSLFIRGANPNHTLVLIDGLRVGSATTGTAMLDSIPLAQVERIEVLRGPASSLYGSEAMGGVIQIFTRKGDGPAQAEVSAGMGSYRTLDTNAALRGSSGALRYAVRAGHFETDGFSAKRDASKQFGYNPDKDGYRQDHFGADLGFRLNADHDLSASVLHSKGENQYDNNANYNSKLYKKLTTVGLTLDSRLSKDWQSLARLGGSIDENQDDATGAARSLFRTKQEQFQWQNTLRLPLGQALLAYEYLRQSVDSTQAYNVTARTINSLLAGWTARIDNHRLQANLRRDDNSQFGGQTTGLLAYGYQLTDALRLNASAGTAYRAPTFNELYWKDTGFGGGNPNLAPEKARNREVGAVWETARQRASVTVFNNRVSNLIAGWPPVNVSTAKLSGSSWAYTAQLGDWRLGGSLDLTRARDEATGLRLVRRPDQAATLFASRHVGGWEIGSELQGVGYRYDDAKNSKRMGGYTLLNLTARTRLSPEWQLEARANNLGDKRYETTWGYGTPGANVFVGLRYQPK